LGEYQCGFRKSRSTTEQLSIIGQIIEKKYEYRQNMWQIFIDFKKAYDSIHRESLYNIMYEFGFPKKLIALTRMCMENTKYRVRTQNITSGTFTVGTGLKQGDALSPVLFNLALEKVVRILQTNEGGLLINQNNIRLLGFADDLDIIGESCADTANAVRVLEEAAKKIGLEINTEKTKIMELIESGEVPNEIEDLNYEKVSDFKYLGATLSTKNDWSKEISIRINKAQKASYALTKFLTSKMLSRKTKVRLYVAIIRPTLTYGCEAWTTTKQTEKNLRVFENRVWRKICGPVIDGTTGNWRRRYNKELYDMLELAPVTSFIKGQRIQWLGHIMRRGENETVRVALEWKPQGKRPRGRPRKRWIDVVEKDLKSLGIEDWREVVQDRDRWRSVVMAAKTLRE
jgi:sorting nexin-29